MDEPTKIFHRQVIRLMKGIISAWETWLQEMEEKKEKGENVEDTLLR
jgi:hypothetical protein